MFDLNKGTLASDIEEYVNEQKINVRAVKLLSHPAASSCSFRVMVGKSDYQKLMCEDVRPEGVMIRKYAVPARDREQKKD